MGYRFTLKHVLTINHSGILSGNGTFLQIPESTIPGCKQLAVTPVKQFVALVKCNNWIRLGETIICEARKRT